MSGWESTDKYGKYDPVFCQPRFNEGKIYASKTVKLSNNYNSAVTEVAIGLLLLYSLLQNYKKKRTRL